MNNIILLLIIVVIIITVIFVYYIKKNYKKILFTILWDYINNLDLKFLDDGLKRHLVLITIEQKLIYVRNKTLGLFSYKKRQLEKVEYFNQIILELKEFDRLNYKLTNNQFIFKLKKIILKLLDI